MKSISYALLWALTVTLLPSGSARCNDYPPPGFVDLIEIDASIQIDLRYLGRDNFLGRPVDGYEANRLIVSEAAGRALARVQAELKPMGLGLLVYDAYRPQRAVDHFVRWAQDLDDQASKNEYYPDVGKDKLFEEGYIAARSGHTRGGTVDLTLLDIQSGQTLDMGTPWDFFGPESWPAFADLLPQQRANRLLLRALMLRHGFRPLEQEWWHFTLEDEPFPETYFNFSIRASTTTP